MDEQEPPQRDRLPSIKQILAILFAGVLLVPGLCLAVGATAGSSGGAVMLGLAALSVVLTVIGAALFMIRAIRDFFRT